MNVLSLFDGMSCGRIALESLGIKVGVYYASEIDKHAIKISKHLYPDTVHLGDIRNINGYDLPQIDLLLGGSPCFVAGTKVITENGYADIEGVKVGDLVLTHNKRYRKVLRIGGKKADIWRLKAQGCLETKTTAEHPYYIRQVIREWDNSNRCYIRYLSEPTWKKVSELQVNTDFIALPIMDNMEANPRGLTNELCWLLGRYVADGYYQDKKRANRNNSYTYKTVICVGKSKAKSFEDSMSTLKYSKREERTVYKYTFNSMELLILIKSIGLGRGAVNKRVPNEILQLPKDLAKSFLDGYMSGDGCFLKGKYKATSVSRELCMGLNLLIAKVYNTNSGITKSNRPKTTVIEGRTVNQRDTYTVDFFTDMKKQSHAMVLDGYVWLPVKAVERLKEVNQVYNLEVEEDNSYTANNAVVHNCQGFSFAGKQLNFEDPRSKLFFEYVRLLKECNPKYFLLENVKMKKEYEDVITKSLGVKPIAINSSLVSAQNRQRLYWTNIPGVTQPEDRGILLKDIVHENTWTDADKSYCIDANYYKGGNAKQYYNKCRRQQVYDIIKEYIVPFDKTLQILDKEVQRGKVGYYRKDSQANRVYYIHDKAVTLCGEAGGGAAKMGQYLFGCITPDRVNKRQNGQRFNGGQKFYTLTAQDRHGILVEGYIRKLTPVECGRLQTVPEDIIYKMINSGVSNTQLYKIFGNGWTVEVIMHFLRGLK